MWIGSEESLHTPSKPANLEGIAWVEGGRGCKEEFGNPALAGMVAGEEKLKLRLECQGQEKVSATVPVG